ncbi:ROK family protein [Oceanivirga salmonicida]|uniref:ROK family protein n=1 Tax=Oceanivirga salmonicida TaxID=1769291 RepID=UPI0008330231|nr:ROK family protein [Oceanivirga salmonicida]
MRTLCFDVGGTYIKYAIIENDRDEIEIKKIKTRITKQDNYILEDIINTIKEYENIDAIGVSTAGVVDSEKGEIAFSGPTIPNYTGTKIKESIENIFKVPCFVENDVNAAAYGEYTYTKSSGTTFMMTIGTGVGGSIILNDNVYNGNSMTAGEIGYMPYKNGYFQDYASARFLTSYASEKLGFEVDGKYIFENAKKGNEVCNEAIDTLIENLCFGILNIIYLLNPKKIIIGGGITAQGTYLENKIKKQLNKKIISEKFKTEICLAKLENSAGLYGMFYITQKGK